MRSGETEHTVARLEREVRRVRAGLLLLLVVAAGLLLAQILPQGRANAVAVFATTALLLAGVEIAGHVWRHGQTVPEILRAKKFEVVDDSGHIFVEIGETVDGRGAVVTHDGGDHGVLTPAHPALTHPAETRASETSPGEAIDPRLETSLDPTGVHVTLVYRGGGVYEAKIVDDATGAPQRPASKVFKKGE